MQRRGRLFGIGADFVELIRLLRQRRQTLGDVLAPCTGVGQRMLHVRRPSERLDDVGLAFLHLRFVPLHDFVHGIEGAFPVAECGLGLLLAFGYLPAQGFTLGDLPAQVVLLFANRLSFFLRGRDTRLKLGLLLGQKLLTLPGLLDRMLEMPEVFLQSTQRGLRGRGAFRRSRAFGVERSSLRIEAGAVALERTPAFLQSADLVEQGRIGPTRQRQVDRSEFVFQRPVSLRLFRLAA